MKKSTFLFFVLLFGVQVGKATSHNTVTSVKIIEKMTNSVAHLVGSYFLFSIVEDIVGAFQSLCEDAAKNTEPKPEQANANASEKKLFYAHCAHLLKMAKYVASKLKIILPVVYFNDDVRMACWELEKNL